jgi:hypothetical protein
MYCRRADDLMVLGEQRLVGELLRRRLGDAKVDDLGGRLTILRAHQHVGRFDVAMDDALAVRVLHGVADLREQLQALFDSQRLSACHRTPQSVLP